MTAQQLVLDLGPDLAPATWGSLRAGMQIHYAGATWRIDLEPKPSVWATPGHPRHCDACAEPRFRSVVDGRLVPPADCDQRVNPPHVSVGLLELHGRPSGYRVVHMPVDEQVEVTS